MKSLILVSQHFPPEMGAASNRMHHVAEHLGKLGYQVHVVTSKPHYPNPNLYSKVDAANIRFNNVNIHRTPVVRLPIPDKGLRIVNQLVFNVLAPWICLYLRVVAKSKVVITTSPPFLVNICGLFLKGLLRMKWVMEVRDLWPDSYQAITNVTTDRSLLYRLMSRLEQRFYDKCDHIVVVTQGSKAWLEKKGVAGEKITVIPNGIPDWARSATEHDRPSKETTKPFVVSYIGNLGLAQNLELLLQAAERTKGQENVRYYLVGEGLAKPKLVQYCRENGLEHVHFIDGIIDKRELVHWYRKTDLGIVILKDAELFEHVIPSKIFELGYFRVPIALVGKGEPAELIRRYRLGWSVGHNIDELEQLIGQVRNGTLHLNRGQNLYNAFIFRYSWENMIKRFVAVIE